MKREIVVVFALILLFNLVSATSTTNFDYDFNSTFSDDSTIHYTESMKLVINTPVETDCYYTSVQSSTPSNSFELNLGTRHEKTFENLPEGLHKYYILCGSSSNPVMQVSFKTVKVVSGNIKISEESPLNDGTYDITIVTSKLTLDTPTLEYSFDGTVYNPIPLEGSGTVWNGHLIVKPTTGEVVASFRFKATDLEGKEGTKITGDTVFIVDTKVPSVVQSFDAIGYLGEIKLSWFLDEEVKEFNIYRSKNPGVDFNDFYLSVDDEDYTDTNVINGKTYYYKVAGVDEAGNIAQFSKEVLGTALISESSTQNTGLNLNLIGKVDNLITEINLFSEDIRQIQSSVNLKEEKEKSFFLDLELDKEFSNALSELTSLKKDVERFKTQDLSEIELDKKLNSAKIRIDILKKKVPESITLVSENSLKRELSEEKITLAVLEFGQEILSEKEISKTIKLSEDLIKENEISITSELFNLEILYLDGTRNEVSLFRDSISSEIERDEDKKVILVIPKDIAKRASEISFQNLNYEVIKEDPVLAFDSDVEKIIYTLEKHIDIDKINDITLSPIQKYSEEISQKSFITGFSVSNLSSYTKGNLLYIVLGVALLLLLLYFIYIKRKRNEKSEIKQKIKKAKKHRKNEEHKELRKVYSEIKEDYKSLSSKEKKKYYSRIKKLHGK